MTTVVLSPEPPELPRGPSLGACVCQEKTTFGQGPWVQSLALGAGRMNTAGCEAMGLGCEPHKLISPPEGFQLPLGATPSLGGPPHPVMCQHSPRGPCA